MGNRNLFVNMGQSKWTGIILNIVLLLMLGAFSIIAYWELKSYEVLTFSDGNYTLDKEVYYQGDEFRIKFKVCKYYDLQEHVLGRFIDGVIFSVPDVTSNFDTGCYDTFLTSVRIPTTLPGGKYVYEETVIYRVNPLKEVSYTFTTPEFTVLERSN